MRTRVIHDTGCQQVEWMMRQWQFFLCCDQIEHASWSRGNSLWMVATRGKSMFQQCGNPGWFQVRLECLSSNPRPLNSSNSLLVLELLECATSSSKPRLDLGAGSWRLFHAVDGPLCFEFVCIWLDLYLQWNIWYILILTYTYCLIMFN